MNQLRDWNEDREREIVAERKNTKRWGILPLLLIPIALFIGYGINEAGDRMRGVDTMTTPQVGIGGGMAPCQSAGDNLQK